MSAAPRLFNPGDSIPPEMKARDQWVVWRYVTRKGKKTKVPFRADAPKSEAKSTDPATWSSYERAARAAADPANELNGIGFVFSEGDGYAGVDFDNCLDESGRVLEWARPFLDRLPGYAEISPSGRGVKLFTRGRVPGGKGKKLQKLGPDAKGAIEVYDAGRYFTVTGRVLDEAHSRLIDGSAELAELHAEWFPPKAPRPRIAPQTTATLDDTAIVARARKARNGAKFSALFDGSTEGHPSKSEADLALCSHLAFWTGGDGGAIDRIFRQSRLNDEKWETRPDYRDMTIEKALDRSTFYDPKYRTNGASNGKHVANDHPGNPPGDGPGPDQPPDPPLAPIEADDDPHRLARVYLAGLRQPECSTLFFWREEWHRWDGAHYRICPDKEVRGELTAAIKAEFDRINIEAQKSRNPDKAPPLTRPVTTRKTSDVLQALTGEAMIRVVDCPEQPAWLCDDPPFPADEVLPCRNALVHLPGLMDGFEPSRYVVAPTPLFFGAYSLGFDYRSDSPRPERWHRFLQEIWPADRESIETLQEWFGYLLTADTSHQKMLMLIGPKRSGRGTIARVIQALLGPENVVTPTLSGFTTHFGAACLIGQPAAIFTDARIGMRSDVSVAVERLLSITGEDAQTIPRKNRDDWKGRLRTRFTLISNELPRLTDASGALPSRMIVLRFTETFIGREDRGLESELVKELPGILMWAIEGWQRLRNRGRFIQPESANDLVEQMEDIASPVGEFVKDTCVVGAAHEILTNELYGAWKEWCQEHGRDHPGDRTAFGRNLTAAFHSIRTSNPTTRGGCGVKVRWYLGIDLNPEEKARQQRRDEEKAKIF